MNEGHLTPRLGKHQHWLGSLPHPHMHRLTRALVLKGLARWRHGRLIVRLPEGSRVVFGPDDAAQQAELSVHDDTFFTRLLLGGELGAGEAYMDELWSSTDLTALLRLFLRNLDALSFDTPLARLGQLTGRLRHSLRRNSRAGSRRNIAAHYDLGNDFYRLFLDDSMTYSCAFYRDGAETLEQAQNNKYERICLKLGLDARDHLLEIGSGWAGFALYAARTRGCRITTATISREQLAFTTQRVREAGLEHQVTAVFGDYRDLGPGLGPRFSRPFDKIVSIEMFEAVGREYFGEYFAACSRLLAPEGLMLMQTIAMPDQRFDSYSHNVDWTQKYIFPGCCIPSLGAITRALGKSSDLLVHDVEDIGPHYALTLKAWRERFTKQRSAVLGLGFDERFLRTWQLYLGFSEASFAERSLSDLQLVLTRPMNRSLPLHGHRV